VKPKRHGTHLEVPLLAEKVPGLQMVQGSVGLSPPEAHMFVGGSKGAHFPVIMLGSQCEELPLRTCLGPMGCVYCAQQRAVSETKPVRRCTPA
jgi:hypothetical protein